LKAVKSLGHYFHPSSTLENKLGLAGSNYELTSSIPSVVDYLGSNPAEAWAAIEKQEEELQGTLLAYLNARPDVTIYGEKEADSKKRVSTISFVVKSRSSQEVVKAVDRVSNGDMGIRWGAFYSNRLVEDVLELGKNGVIRVSMVHYNTCKL
jgi:selenocysteine lyase/cysteine desulfurase